MLIAILCGALVGEERQKSEKPAGLRTLILVCLGSAVFTLVSFAFNGNPADATRVAAQIVTGIGFLGAGVIMREHGTVSGTTTAATIWVMAAVGMVVGNGYAGAAVVLATLVRFVLGTISFFENHIAGELEHRSIQIDFDPDHGKTRARLERILVELRRASVRIRWDEGEAGTTRLLLNLHLRRRASAELLDLIANLPAVLAIHDLTAASNQPNTHQNR